MPQYTWGDVSDWAWNLIYTDPSYALLNTPVNTAGWSEATAAVNGAIAYYEKGRGEGKTYDEALIAAKQLFLTSAASAILRLTANSEKAGAFALVTTGDGITDPAVGDALSSPPASGSAPAGTAGAVKTATTSFLSKLKSSNPVFFGFLLVLLPLGLLALGYKVFEKIRKR